MSVEDFIRQYPEKTISFRNAEPYDEIRLVANRCCVARGDDVCSDLGWQLKIAADKTSIIISIETARNLEEALRQILEHAGAVKDSEP